MLLRLAITALLVLAGAAPSLAAGDPVAGAVVFKKCGACHTATEPLNRVGPSLMGVVGRPVATFKDYNYSDAMRSFGADGKVWDEARLSAYLIGLRGMVPGTKMTFPGLKKPKDIADVVAYLKQAGMPQ